MTTSKQIQALERARTGLLHTLAILDAANRAPANDIADLDVLINAARDLCGRHLEETDDAIDGLRAEVKNEQRHHAPYGCVSPCSQSSTRPTSCLCRQIGASQGIARNYDQWSRF